MSDKSPPASAPSTEGGGDGSKSSKKEGKKKPNPNIVIPPKKPKLSKAERRALQEAQRAAKAGGGNPQQGKKGGDGGGGKKTSAPGSGDGGKKGKKPTPIDGSEEKKEDEAKEAGLDKSFALFSHLPPFRDPNQDVNEFSGVTLSSKTSSEPLHPAVLSLGLQYATGQIRGGNARCTAMLRTFQSVLSTYTPPPDCKDFRHDLDHRILKPSFQHWTSRCRPHSVTMGNAFTFLKMAVANLDRDVALELARETLIETIDAYIQERIVFADKAISKYASSKIVDGDVIITYGKSEVIEVILQNAASTKQFRVIVVDSRPLLEGRVLLNRLASHGIECTYVLLNALSYVMMREVTKVFLGAAALLSDGSVLSRIGTGGVALLAGSSNVPVLVCCETYKISNRVQLESVTGNELGDPDDIVATRCAIDRNPETVANVGTENGSMTALAPGQVGSPLSDWRTTPNLRVLNLLYDLTPSEFVSGIVTEMGILPPTSVAVLLREMNPQDNADSAFKSV